MMTRFPSPSPSSSPSLSSIAIVMIIVGFNILTFFPRLAYPRSPPQEEMLLRIRHRFNEISDVLDNPTPPPPPSANTTTIVLGKSRVITLNQPFGQYFVVLGLGTPPSNITVIIDTGSEALWVQCQPCRQCGLQDHDPIYDPRLSSTFRPLDCQSDWCYDENGVAMGCGLHNSTESELCLYNATYADGSSSFGVLSQDKLWIPGANAPCDMVFGCGNDNAGVETNFNSSGVLGLDRANHSMVSQLGIHKFAICLPDRTQRVDVDGFLSFDIDYNGYPPLQYTPLLTNNASAFYAQSYYMPLLSLSVGSQRVNVSPEWFQIDSRNGGGTLIDTGTTITSFVDEVYAGFRKQMMTQMRETILGSIYMVIPTLVEAFDTCYAVPLQYSVLHLPNATLHFEGGFSWELPPENIWVFTGEQQKRSASGEEEREAMIYCLAFSSVGSRVSGGRNVIGNFQMQNWLVEYDLANERIGFARTLCNDDSPSSSQAPGSHVTLIARSYYYCPSIAILIVLLWVMY